MPDQPHKPATFVLVSEFAGDPVMSDLIAQFLHELPARLDLLGDLWRDRKYHDVQRLTHQLRGASAGYGFPAIGLVAGKIENRLRALPPQRAPQDLSAIAADIDELVNLCQCALRAFPA